MVVDRELISQVKTKKLRVAMKTYFSLTTLVKIHFVHLTSICWVSSIMTSTVFAKGNTKEMPSVITALLKHFENNLEGTTYLLQLSI